MKMLISHSEVEAKTQCAKKHDYAHNQKLQPIGHSMALNRGNAGHTMLEVFFLAIKAGTPTEKAKMLAMSAPKLKEYPIEAVGEAMALVMPWIDNVWPGLGWKIIEVEKEFRVPITDTLIFPFKCDLLIEYRGEIFFVDHKFTYDAYSDEVIEVLAQLPKYIGGIRKLGIPVVGGKYNFFRTRKLKNVMDAFVVKEVPVSDQRILNTMRDQVQVMKQIETERGNAELKVNQSRPIRTANKMNCANCGFINLCTAELNGRDTTKMREANFVPNTYGYKELPE